MNAKMFSLPPNIHISIYHIEQAGTNSRGHGFRMIVTMSIVPKGAKMFRSCWSYTFSGRPPRKIDLASEEERGLKALGVLTQGCPGFVSEWGT
jgi:hypothetical protein